MKKKLAKWASEHKVGLSMAVSVIGLGVGVGVIACEPGWVRGAEVGTESGSTTIRNLGFVIAGLIALPLAVWRAKAADQQARATEQQAETALRQAETAQADLRNKRYQESAAMLGSDVLAVRFAGIYALQYLAEDHPGEYHIEVMRLLCAFVRNPTKDESVGTDKGREDVQAAMEAISACHGEQLRLEDEMAFELDLRGANLAGVILIAANLSKSTDLSLAHLDSAHLRGVKLMGARLIAAELRDVDFLGADLSRADFTLTKLEGASFEYAKLSGASFAFPFDSDEIPTPGSASGLTQEQLDYARADPENPPYLGGVRDAETGKQLVWRGNTLDGKPHPNPPPIPHD